MKIAKATMEGMTLRLELEDFGSRQEAGRFVFGFKPGDYEVKHKRKKRSLDANAYYWELCGQLARALNLTTTEIYRRHIADMGNYEIYGMPRVAAERFNELWCSDHLGRFTETRAAKMPGIVNVLAYYGSSDFDTHQMSRLIDNCVQDCHAVGIETRPQEEIDSLLGEWK